jgi:hypothetical protein
VVCRGICACRACLRENKSVLEVPPPEEQTVAARYVLELGAPRLLEVLQAEEEEVGGGWAKGLLVLQCVPDEVCATQQQQHCFQHHTPVRLQTMPQAEGHSCSCQGLLLVQ